MKKGMKKSTGDSTAVAKVVPSVKGMQKAKSNATSYNKEVFHKTSAPSYPYGQPHKAVKSLENKTMAMKGPVKKK